MKKNVPSLRLYRLCIALLLIALVLVSAAYIALRDRVHQLESAQADALPSISVTTPIHLEPRPTADRYQFELRMEAQPAEPSPTR
jgi:hypothetical protein